MVEADAPISSASSRIEAAPSRRRRSRIMARRLAGMISTRFDGVSISHSRRHEVRCRALPAEHKKASTCETVAKTDGRLWMREMRRRAGNEGPCAETGKSGEGRVGERGPHRDGLGVSRNAMSGPGAGEKAPHQKSV